MSEGPKASCKESPAAPSSSPLQPHYVGSPPERRLRHIMYGVLPADISSLRCGNCGRSMTDEGADVACVPCGIFWSKELWDEPDDVLPVSGGRPDIMTDIVGVDPGSLRP
jgi:hypothetical protein